MIDIVIHCFNRYKINDKKCIDRGYIYTDENKFLHTALFANNSGDVNAIGRVHEFLELYGSINFGSEISMKVRNFKDPINH